MNKKVRNIAVSMLSLMLAGTTGITAFASQQPELPSLFDPAVREEAESTFSIQNREAVLKSNGYLWNEWNDEAGRQREKGLHAQLSREELQKSGQNVQIMEENGEVYQISGDRLPLSVTGDLDAYCAVYRLISVLGGNENTELMMTSRIQAGEHTIYVFQQVQNGMTVLGSTVRLAVAPSENFGDNGSVVTAVFNSLVKTEPETASIREINEEEALKIVNSRISENGPQVRILPEYTSRILVPQEEEDPDLLLWVIYSENPDKAEKAGFPYLAHYLMADGTYLYCSPVKEPVDEAGQSGYTSAYMFDNMTVEFWKGDVVFLDGETKNITLPVMKDETTGIYYLGDAERKIAVGEYYDYAYENEELILVSSENNQDWRNDDLITYANYLTVWDYYADMGWTGPDGSGTPSLLLRDMCLESGEALDNAAYLGLYRGWQTFGYDNSTYHFGEALDVMAHEFTHCVSGTAEGNNLYENDCGAVNESLSDIMGNLCEAEYQKDTDISLLIGEDSLIPIRSMADPHMFGQPEYVWDVYYTPHTETPNEMNDRGGVHSNSSILNLLASRLCREDKMSVEDAKAFWMTVICASTPRTDLIQMADLLKWAVKASGNSGYVQAVERQIENCRMSAGIPETMEEGRVLVSLQLPDTEAMKDENWILQGIQIRSDRIGDLIRDLGDIIVGGEGTEEEVFNNIITIASNICDTHSSWVSDESRTMNMVLEDRFTVYTLLNMDMETFEVRGAAVLLGDQWLDLGPVLEGFSLNGDFSAMTEEEAEEKLEESLEEAFGDYKGNLIVEAGKMLLSHVLGMYSSDNETGIRVLPAEGLEKIQLSQAG